MTIVASPCAAAPVPWPMHDQTQWCVEAITAYQQLEQEESTVLPALLAARIGELTGRAVSLSAIWIDRAAHTATVTVDGVTFRMRQRTLTLIWPCAAAPSGYVESAPIAHLSDLGYALLAWEAERNAASPEHDEDWSYSW